MCTRTTTDPAVALTVTKEALIPNREAYCAMKAAVSNSSAGVSSWKRAATLKASDATVCVTSLVRLTKIVVVMFTPPPPPPPPPSSSTGVSPTSDTHRPLGLS